MLYGTNASSPSGSSPHAFSYLDANKPQDQDRFSDILFDKSGLSGTIHSSGFVGGGHPAGSGASTATIKQPTRYILNNPTLYRPIGTGGSGPAPGTPAAPGLRPSQTRYMFLSTGQGPRFSIGSRSTVFGGSFPGGGIYKQNPSGLSGIDDHLSGFFSGNIGQIFTRVYRSGVSTVTGAAAGFATGGFYGAIAGAGYGAYRGVANTSRANPQSVGTMSLQSVAGGSIIGLPTGYIAARTAATTPALFGSGAARYGIGGTIQNVISGLFTGTAKAAGTVAQQAAATTAATAATQALMPAGQGVLKAGLSSGAGGNQNPLGLPNFLTAGLNPQPSDMTPYNPGGGGSSAMPDYSSLPAPIQAGVSLPLILIAGGVGVTALVMLLKRKSGKRK